MTKQRKELKFYTPEEERELKRALAENVDLKEYVKRYAEAFERTPASLLAKLKSLSNKQESKFSHQQETILKHCLLRYRDWETDRKSTRLNSSHSAKTRMPSSA